MSARSSSISFLFGYLGAASPPGWHPRGRCHHSAARQQHHGGWVHSGQTKWHQETLVEEPQEPQEPLPGSDVKLDFLHCRSMPLSKDVNELSSEAWYVTRSSHVRNCYKKVRRVTTMDRHQLAEFFESFLMLQAPEESEGGPEEARWYWGVAKTVKS